MKIEITKGELLPFPNNPNLPIRTYRISLGKAIPFPKECITHMHIGEQQVAHEESKKIEFSDSSDH